MAIVNLSPSQQAPAACRQGVASIGNFDGVHRGHQALLARNRAAAQRLGGPAVAVTFDPHPLQLLRPDQFMPVLTPAADRAELLQRHVDQVVVLRTTPELLQLSAEDFFHRLVIGSLQARGLVEGWNFAFGRGRQGSVATLTELCQGAGLAIEVVAAAALGGAPISSSRVRDALLGGDVRQAAELLGRPYSVRGTVGSGQQRGRTLGFPTANLQDIEALIPRDGVYAVRVHWQQQSWPGAANLGPNPTFGEQARKVEVHLIGFQGGLLGQELRVEFIDRLRDTRAFAGPNELAAQLHADINQARALAGKGPS